MARSSACERNVDLSSQEIIVVSGLPRSGTSLMMQMLDFGGIETLTDQIREADTDNPRGYYEYEIVKKIKDDASWVPSTRGKAFKMVSQLLYHLPANEQYKIIFMRRDFDEMLASQEKMLSRLGHPAAPRDQIKSSFARHLERLEAWLDHQTNMGLLPVNYNDLMREPRAQVDRICEFLGGRADPERMSTAIDPALYRNRKS